MYCSIRVQEDMLRGGGRGGGGAWAKSHLGTNFRL